MFENANSTAAEQVASGEQETVVESQAENTAAEDTGFDAESRKNDFMLVDDGRESVVDSHEGGTEEGSEVGEDGGEGRQPDSAGQAGAKKQSREENAAMRSIRLRAQQEAEAAERARTDEIIASSGGVNPYTGKPFTGLQDFLDYTKKYRESAIREEAEKSGKTVEQVTEEMDDRDFVRNLRRQQAQQPTGAQDTDEMAFLRQDVLNFVERHPDVDVAQLEQNQHFLKFCGSRFKKEPLADLYDAYQEFRGGVEKAAVVKAASKAERSTGGGTSGGTALTPSQQSMLDAWNRENPDMPMTAKDFFRKR